MNLHLAHVLSGGSSLESMVLAIGVIILGAAFLLQRSVDRKVSILMVVIGVFGVVASLTFLKDLSSGGRSITVQGQTYTEADLQEAVVGLCDARDAAAEDVDAANTIFVDKTHVPLHVVVAAIEDDDRPLAGRLLEAKQKVEQDLIDDVPGEKLEEDLDELASTAALAMESLSMIPPAC